MTHPKDPKKTPPAPDQDAAVRELQNRLEQEINSRQQVQRALSLFKKSYQAIFDNMIDAYYRTDVNGKLVLASPSTARLLGYDSTAEIIGKNAAEFYADPQERKRLIAQIVNNGSATFQNTLRRKDGSLVFVETNSQMVYDEAGNPKGIEGIVRDITARKTAEDELRRSREKYRHLFQNAQVGMFRSALDGSRFLAVNAKLAEIFECSAEALMASIPLTRWPQPHKRGQLIQTLRQTEKVIDHEVEVIAASGNKKILLTSVKLYPEDGGYLEGSAVDITGRKAMEQELRRKSLNLEQVNTALELLLAKRHQDRMDLEKNVLTNVKDLIAPYLGKIKTTVLDGYQRTLLELLESNLNEITSAFARTLPLQFLSLTPTEIQIANLIKHGNSTKTIARLMGISPRTVDTHRKNIRKKMQLENKSINLRSHLITLG